MSGIVDCVNCVFWKGVSGLGIGVARGRCRVEGPKIRREQTDDGSWPEVDITEGCGAGEERAHFHGALGLHNGQEVDVIDSDGKIVSTGIIQRIDDDAVWLENVVHSSSQELTRQHKPEEE